MRSIFDQYDAPENRLTHALGCCLERDPRLLRQFIRWVCPGATVPMGGLEVLEQQVPGTPAASWDEDESKGLPDLWVHGQGDWCLLVESKVQAKVSADQLRRHVRTAEHNGFTDICLLVLAPEIPSRQLPNVIYRTWPDLYVWLRRRVRKSVWAACMGEYMEVAEARMIADDYLGVKPLTKFDGIPFGLDHPYTYREAKRVLRLAMAELRQCSDLRRRLDMDPKGPGRPAITGREGTSVWDFLRFTKARKLNFTAYPHLTLGIGTQRVLVYVTLPNGAPAYMRRNLTRRGLAEFVALVGQVEAGISKALAPIRGACPRMEANQRHYPSQRAAPIVDASLEFNPQTAGSSHHPNVKTQPQWAEAIFRSLSQKRSNLQVGIGAVLPYGDPHLCSRAVLDVIAGVWLACRPWIRTVLGKK